MSSSAWDQDSSTGEGPPTVAAASRSRGAVEGHATAAANPRGFGRILLQVSVLTMVAQGCGFASSVVIAHVLGATRSTDAYYLGLSAPLLVYGVFVAAVRQGGIPILTSETASGGVTFADASSEFVSATLGASIIIALIATALAVGLMPLTVGNPRLVGPANLDAIELMPLGVLGGVIGALASILAVRNRFAAAALVLGLDPMLRIVLLVVAGRQMGTHALVIANLAGNALAVLVMWTLVVREGIPLRLRLPLCARCWTRPATIVVWLPSRFVRRALAVSAPLVAGQAVLQTNPVVDRTMASGLGAGSITSLELGLRLFAVPMILIGATLIGPVMATWSARRAVGGWEALRDSLNRSVNAFALALPPILVVGIVLRHQIVGVLYQGGAYSAHATDVTATVFAMMLVGLPAQLLTIVFSALFIVEQQTMFCLKVGLLNVLLNVALNFVLRPVLGVGGIALSTSVTMTILLGLYIGSARRRWPGIAIPFSGAAGLRSAATVGVMAIFAYVLKAAMPGWDSRAKVLAEVVVIGIAVLGVYGLALLAIDPRASALLWRLRQIMSRDSIGQEPPGVGRA